MAHVQQPKVRSGLLLQARPVELCGVVRVGDRLGPTDVALDGVVDVLVQAAIEQHHLQRVASRPAGEGSRVGERAVSLPTKDLVVQAFSGNQSAVEE